VALLVPGFTTRLVDANGQPAVVVYLQGKLLRVLIPNIDEGRIREFDRVLNSDKLRRIPDPRH